MTPLGNRVLIKDEKKDKTDSGFYLAPGAQDDVSNKGVVSKAGTDADTKWEGLTVYYRDFTAISVGEDKILDVSDIIAIEGEHNG